MASVDATHLDFNGILDRFHFNTVNGSAAVSIAKLINTFHSPRWKQAAQAARRRGATAKLETWLPTGPYKV